MEHTFYTLIQLIPLPDFSKGTLKYRPYLCLHGIGTHTLSVHAISVYPLLVTLT